MSVDVTREAIEAFLQQIGDTNFEIIARGNSLSGPIESRIIKETKIFGTSIEPSRVRVDPSRHMDGTGAKRDFLQAANAIKAGDVVRACEILVNSYCNEVELRPLGQASNLEPLIWRQNVENGVWTGHGGARIGAGRPSVLGESKLVSIDIPLSLLNDLDTQAKERAISRAELMRELLTKGLKAQASS